MGTLKYPKYHKKSRVLGNKQHQSPAIQFLLRLDFVLSLLNITAERIGQFFQLLYQGIENTFGGSNSPG